MSLTEVQGKGRGLVVTKEFKKGDLIFTETAAISVDGFGEGIQVWGVDPKNLPMSKDPTIMKSFMDQVMALSDRERNKLFEGDLKLAKREKIICLDMFLIKHAHLTQLKEFWSQRKLEERTRRKWSFELLRVLPKERR